MAGRPGGCHPSRKGGPRALPGTTLLKISTQMVNFKCFLNLIFLQIFKILEVFFLLVIVTIFLAVLSFS